MDEELDKINLLPEDLRGEEDKLRSKNIQEAPPKYHFPQATNTSNRPPVPPRPVSVPIVKKEISEVKSSLDVGKQREVSARDRSASGGKGKSGFKLFGQLFKKAKEEKVFSQIKVDPTATPAKTFNVEAEKGPLSTRMDVNLIPEGAYMLTVKKIMFSLGNKALLSLFVVLLIYIGLFFYTKLLENQSEKLTIELEEKEARFQIYKTLEAEAELLRKKVESTGSILDRHIYWTNVFSALERLTVQDVYYDSINATLNGSITLSAKATNYTAVARQYLVFQQADDVIKSVQISGTSGDSLIEGVTFNVIITLIPELFLLERESLTPSQTN